MELHRRDARALQRAPVREHLGPRLDRKVANRPVPREPGVRPAAGIEDTDGGLDLYPTTHRPSMSARSARQRSQHSMAGKAGAQWPVRATTRPTPRAQTDQDRATRLLSRGSSSEARVRGRREPSA